MKKLMLVAGAFAVCAMGASAEVMHVLAYNSGTSSLGSIAQESINGLASMANQTGELKGDGQQHIVYHDGTTLISYSYGAGALNTSSYKVGVAVPDQLVTGGHIGADAYNGDSVAVYDSTGFAYVYAGTGSQFSYYRGRALGTGYVEFGLGNVIDSGYAGSELLGYYTSEKTYAWTGSGASSLGAPVIGNYPHMHDNADLMDLHQVDMSSHSLNNMMIGFSGDYLVLQGPDGNHFADRNIGLNLGAADEALFLQAGNVHSYSSEGTEEGVVYREDGSIEAWTAKSGGGFTTAVNSTSIGTGVTEMLLGDILGDGIEEVVVSKGDTIEVWSLATGYAVLEESYTFGDTVVDFALGDMDGDGKQDIIAGVIPEPATLGLLGFTGFAVFFIRKRFLI